MDGTLLDTAPDLAYALNLVLKQHNMQKVSLQKVRAVASDGIKRLLNLGFGIAEDHADIHELRNEFLHYYSINISRKTKLYAGMAEVLSYLALQNIPWGIVTNKIASLTDKLLANLNLQQQAVCVISGDTLHVSKPHPAPLLHACQLAGCSPQESIYVGDAQRDIEAGQRAGMFTIAALYGYINENEDPHNWQADKYIRHPNELMNFLALND